MTSAQELTKPRRNMSASLVRLTSLKELATPKLWEPSTATSFQENGTVIVMKFTVNISMIKDEENNKSATATKALYNI
tara:strand:+ start:436 stop:669 length:234 start_codon:yes stop_codon:yes gene_type:complete